MKYKISKSSIKIKFDSVGVEQKDGCIRFVFSYNSIPHYYSDYFVLTDGDFLTYGKVCGIIKLKLSNT